MAPKQRQWSAVEQPRRPNGTKSARYYPAPGLLLLTSGTRAWFDGQTRIDILSSDDGAYALRRNGTMAKVSRQGSYTRICRRYLTLPERTALAVYEDGDLLVIDPNGDA